MAQIFHRSINLYSKASIVAVVLLGGAAFAGLFAFERSPYITYQGVTKPQPVPFSHQHHVAGLGIDCRYCHTSVETSNYASIPPTKTCMNCHSQIWTNAALLEPVRESYRSGHSLVWSKLNDLPDFVYFNHSIHINKGVGCNTCHGPVDKMPLMYAANTLQMEWCLECHRAPERFLRPRDQVFNMEYKQPTGDAPVAVDGKDYTDQEALGKALVAKYHLRNTSDITSCSTCHR